MKKLVIGSLLVAAAFGACAEEVKQDHFIKEVSLYEKSGAKNRVITYYDTYVRKQYCVEASTQYWQKYWTDISLYSGFDAVVICTNKNNKYDFVQTICDKDMNCQYK